VADAESAIGRLKEMGKTATPILFVRDDVAELNPNAIEQVSGAIPNLILIMVYGDPSPISALVRLGRFSSINHLIPLNSENSRQLIRKTASGEDQSVKSYWESLVPKKLVDRHDHVFRNSGDCDGVYDEIVDYTRNLPCFSTFDSIVRTVTSELLTNAFYNGKKNPKTGTSVVHDRRVNFNLDGNESITLCYGHEGNYLWIIVRDPFGTLSRDAFISSICRAAVSRTPKMDSPGGAGLGLMMIYDWATELNVAVEPNRSTTVACKIKLTSRNRLFQEEPSSMHFFTL
jgi:anti-sigma regulatory factor (Ser/Thr protein kinase)